VHIRLKKHTSTYQPVLTGSGIVSDKIPVPFFTIRVEPYLTEDKLTLQAIIDALKAENIYKKDLIYTGIYAARLRRTGSLGRRSQTYAVTEKAFWKSLRRYHWWLKPYDNNPLLHMRVEGKKTPAIVVFDGSKLESGEFFEEAQKVSHAKRIAWWTRDGASVNEAVVAVFYFVYYEV
jgi:hypothetical protein